MKDIKTCSTCGHNNYSQCMLSGYSCTAERKHNIACGKSFSGWIPKPPKKGLRDKILDFWYGT